MFFYNRVAVYDDFGGLGFEEESIKMANALGNKQHMILANHGIITTGETVAEGFNSLYYFEKAAETYITALSTNKNLNIYFDNTSTSCRCREIQKKFLFFTFLHYYAGGVYHGYPPTKVIMLLQKLIGWMGYSVEPPMDNVIPEYFLSRGINHSHHHKHLCLWINGFSNTYTTIKTTEKN